MGDLATLAKARRELEDLYSGIPDESVNLTFQDLAQLQQHHHHHPTTTLERKKSGLNPISEAAAALASSSAASTPKREIKISSSSSSSRSALTKLPSLDFNRAFEASNNHQHQQHNNNHHDKDHYHHNIMNMQDSSGNDQHGRHHPYPHPVDDQEELALHDYASQGGKYPYDHHHHGNAHGHHHHHPHAVSGHRADDQRLGFIISSSSMVFDDDISSHKMSTGPNSFQANAAAAGRRRPGIPHSNICTICSVYIYMFRHRCLVCGRVYCRQCVSIGMGEMTEGRKCIGCLGKRFSQRYIQKAGKIGCWAGCCMGYPSSAKLQELKWAEKGPRRSGENRYGGGRSGMISRSRSPMTPRTPHIPSTPPSFVASSPYSPYSPANYHLPL